jgi:hypothetical protein
MRQYHTAVPWIHAVCLCTLRGILVAPVRGTNGPGIREDGILVPLRFATGQVTHLFKSHFVFCKMEKISRALSELQ